MTTAIDYTNFKDSVKDRQGVERANVYLRVWSAVHGIATRRGRQLSLYGRGY